jgi:DNA modification methylase
MLQRAEDLAVTWAYVDDHLQMADGLTLLDNVQFIYELALAELELESLKVDFQVTNGLRRFNLLSEIDEGRLRRRLAYFKYVRGKPTDYYKTIVRNRTNSVNQYLTHWIYPYKGKFHPQMVRALLNILKVEPGERILDPFIGSGTTAIEAQLLGIDCIGVDASPLCVLQANVKTQSVLHIEQINNSLENVSAKISGGAFGPLNMSSILEGVTDERVRDFYQMAKLIAVSDNARRGKDIHRSFVNAVQQMIESVNDYATLAKDLNLKLGRVNVRQGDARRLEVEDESVHAIITSPPYSIALDYIANDAHALRELGKDPVKLREEFIGVRGKGSAKVELYDEDMKKSIDEMYRVLKRGRYAAIVIGNATYLGKKINTVDFVIEQAGKAGFELVRDIDKIIFGLYNVIQKENILIFRK